VNDWGEDVENLFGQTHRRAGARLPNCLSQAALDRLALGETDPGEADRAHAHLAACKSCAEMKAFLERDRAAFLIEANVDALAADALARASLAGSGSRSGDLIGAAAPWWRRLLPGLTLLAAATATLVLLPRSGSRRATDEAAATNPAMTIKGGFGLTVYVLHTEGTPAASEPAADVRGGLHLGEALHPGDRIRLELSGADQGDRHPLVLAVDQGANVSVYFPPPTTPSLSVSASSPRVAVMTTSGAGNPATGEDRPRAPGQLLPTAIELDDTLGAETIIALACRAGVTVDDATNAIRAAVVTTAAGTAVRAGDLGLPCQQARYLIKKVPR
jgi:hypothetical protein